MNKEKLNNNRDTFITSDNHFGHFNIIKYTNRPFKSVYEMDAALINNWNEVVKPEDLVYCNGDFSFISDKYVDKLNGEIILIRGNHDNKKYDSLFKEVVDLAEIKIDEFKCLMIHTPIEYDRIYKKGQEPDFSLLKVYDFILCGHIHNLWKVKDKNVNVGVDVWDMKPINIKDLARFLRSLTL